GAITRARGRGDAPPAPEKMQMAEALQQLEGQLAELSAKLRDKSDDLALRDKEIDLVDARERDRIHIEERRVAGELLIKNKQANASMPPQPPPQPPPLDPREELRMKLAADARKHDKTLESRERVAEKTATVKPAIK